jgi:hypothetical protein
MFNKPFRGWGLVLMIALLVPLCLRLQASDISFAPGDVFVSLEPGPVQWFGPDGTLRSVLVPTLPGTGEGMAFDASGNLHVTRWCVDGPCNTGNNVEKFNVLGVSMGAVGKGFNCNPHTIVFDAAGSAYVGQAGCRRTIMKFVQTEISPTEHTVAVENQGVFWMDLAPDGCTMFYTSFGPNVKRFDMCTNTQLANFNAVPLPGMGQDLRVLPDGGVLVSSGQVIARLNNTGVVTQTYQVPGEGALWAGLDLADNNTTFWVGNYYSSNVHKFNLADGTRLAGFNARTPPNTVVGVRVLKKTWQ